MFAVAAAAGSGALLVLLTLGVPVMLAGAVCIVVTAALRLAAVHFDWTCPEQRSLLRTRE